MESTMKRATFVGGSLTGLAAGILLRNVINCGILSDEATDPPASRNFRLCGTKGDGDGGVTLNYRKWF
jgi:hypothetical protein